MNDHHECSASSCISQRGSFLKVRISRCPVLIFGALFVALTIPAIHAQPVSSLPLMPMPRHISQGTGQLKIDSSFTIGLDGYKDARLEAARKRFINTLSRATGIPYHDDASGDELTLVVKTAGPSDAVQRLRAGECVHLARTA